MSSARAAIRRHLVIMVASVVVLDAVAIAVYYLADVPHMAVRTRQYYTFGWMILTLVVVLRGLRAIRAERDAARHARR